MVITVLKQTLSNAFEKSPSTITVTSLLFTALNRSSLIRNSTVEVKCPLRKLEMVSLKRDSLEQKSVIWEATSFSNTFDNTGRIDTGRKSSSVTGVSTFGMGLIRASFQARGKYNFEIQLLMIVVSGPAKCPATSFTNLAGSWSGPVEQSVRSCLKGSQDFSLCNTFQVKSALFIRKTANELEEFILVGRLIIKRSTCGRSKVKIKLVWVKP